MEMEEINAKLDIFTGMVLKEASHRASLLLNDARNENRKITEEKELAFLRTAYHQIQDTVNRIERENNEMVSARLFEAKQLLYRKRQDIMEGVFEKVQARLEQYHEKPNYRKKLKGLIEKGLQQTGTGNRSVIVDQRDIATTRAIQDEIRQDFEIEESEAPLYGGCLVVNRNTGLLADYSFAGRLQQQREVFLEMSGMSISLEISN